MYAYGLRIGEAAKVEISDIENTKGVLRIIGKGDKERRVPLPQPLAKARPAPLISQIGRRRRALAPRRTWRKTYPPQRFRNSDRMPYPHCTREA